MNLYQLSMKVNDTACFTDWKKKKKIMIFLNISVVVSFWFSSQVTFTQLSFFLQSLKIMLIHDYFSSVTAWHLYDVSWFLSFFNEKQGNGASNGDRLSKSKMLHQSKDVRIILL